MTVQDMIPNSDSVRLAAAIIEQICAAKGLQLDGRTIDAAVQSQVAKVAAQMGVTDRNALGYVPPEKLAVEVAANLITAHELHQQIRHNPADPPSRFGRDALVYTTAPAATVCARCDEPITKGEPAVSVPGLYRRGLAHESCVRHI